MTYLYISILFENLSNYILTEKIKKETIMNIKEAKQEAMNAIKTYLLKDEDGNYLIPINRQRPIAFLGPAGVGKTDIARQLAEELNLGFLSYTITHHTRQSAAGLPKIVKKSYQGEENIVTEYTMSEIISSIYDYIEKYNKTNGILFIDEFNCASETLAATMLQFLQNKTFGAKSVPEGWKIILAGNPSEYNKSVKELDLVTMDRLRIIPITPDFEAWKEYAIGKKIHPCILSYLTQKQSSFCVFTNDNEGKQLVTARGWEELSNTIYIYEKMGFDINNNIVSQFINHKKISAEFTNYYDLFTHIISAEEISDILSGKENIELSQRLKKLSFDQRCSVIWILTSNLQATAKEYAKLTTMCDELHALILDLKDKKSFDSIKVADVSKDSRNFINKFVKTLKNNDFNENFKILEKSFKELVSQRNYYLELGNKMISNILIFVTNTFNSGGEIEILLNNLSIDKSIARLLVETGNNEYILYNSQFIENYKTEKISARVRKI